METSLYSANQPLLSSRENFLQQPGSVVVTVKLYLYIRSISAKEKSENTVERRLSEGLLSEHDFNKSHYGQTSMGEKH